MIKIERQWKRCPQMLAQLNICLFVCPQLLTWLNCCSSQVVDLVELFGSTVTPLGLRFEYVRSLLPSLCDFISVVLKLTLTITLTWLTEL